MRLALFALIFASLILASQDIENEEFFNLLPDEIKKDIVSSNVQNAEIELENNLKEKVSEFDQPLITKFGYDYFSYTSDTQVPLLDLPLNSDYVLSFDDEIEIFLSGTENKVLSGRINLSGNLFIPEIGSVNLVNLTINQANKRIKAIVSKKYYGTESDLSVKKATAKKTPSVKK